MIEYYLVGLLVSCVVVIIILNRRTETFNDLEYGGSKIRFVDYPKYTSYRNGVISVPNSLMYI
jgi:hypothetical protein